MGFKWSEQPITREAGGKSQVGPQPGGFGQVERAWPSRVRDRWREYMRERERSRERKRMAERVTWRRRRDARGRGR